MDALLQMRQQMLLLLPSLAEMAAPCCAPQDDAEREAALQGRAAAVYPQSQICRRPAVHRSAKTRLATQLPKLVAEQVPP